MPLETEIILDAEMYLQLHFKQPDKKKKVVFLTLEATRAAL